MPFRPTTNAIRTVIHPVLFAAALTAALLCARPGHGGEGDSDHARAVELFEQSERHYRSGELEKAQELLLRAYELDPNPVLQFNLGRVYEGLGKLEEAASAFRAFLTGSPEAADRGAIERRIESLDRQIAERKALQERNRRPTPPPAPAPPKPQPRHTGPGAAPWIVAGVGAVVLVGGAVSGLLAQRAHDDAVQDSSFQGAKDSQARAENLATVANVGFAVGATAVAVGVGWAVFDKSGQPDSSPSANLGGPTTLVFRGRF